MKINLKKPLIFFDLESTGLNISKDRIVEISAIKVNIDGSIEEKTKRIKPIDDNGNTMHIPEQASNLHHITDEDVKDCPTFKQLAKSFANWMDGCDIAGYNSNKYDIPLLEEEFIRAGVDFDFRKRKLIDVQNIFHKMEKRTLEAAYKFYCNKELANAHSAQADTMATYEVLMAQLDKYSEELQNDVDFLSDFSTQTKNIDYAGRFVWNEKKQAVFNFGKHKDKLVVDVLTKEPSYYSWMQEGDFTQDTKRILTDIKLHPENYK